MTIFFNGTYDSYEGTINTSGGNNSYNPDHLGTPNTLAFSSGDLNDANTDVFVNGSTTPANFFVEQWGTMTSAIDGNDYEYVIIDVDGTLYMLLHSNGIGVPLGGADDPFQTGNQNQLDPTPYCFVRGSRILTENGDIPVEELCIGDAIHTRNNGMQAISWIGKRAMQGEATSRHIPIRINANALGNGLPKRDLLVSPQHRILLTDWRAELLFGEPEVLVAAKHLVNDDTIRVAVDLGEFEYFHILFDSHQTIFSEGLPTESFHPGDMAMSSLSEASRNEILELFPELAEGIENYGPLTHTSLKAFEAKALQSK